MPTWVSKVHFSPRENSSERLGVNSASYTRLFFIATLCEKDCKLNNRKKKKILFFHFDTDIIFSDLTVWFITLILDDASYKSIMLHLLHKTDN